MRVKGSIHISVSSLLSSFCQGRKGEEEGGRRGRGRGRGREDGHWEGIVCL